MLKLFYRLIMIDSICFTPRCQDIQNIYGENRRVKDSGILPLPRRKTHNPSSALICPATLLYGRTRLLTTVPKSEVLPELGATNGPLC